MNKIFSTVKFNFGKKENVRMEEEHVARVLNEKSDFYTVETYKAMRTNIMFSMPKTDSGKVIAITSSSPGEGKTTTCINLAISFAQMGAKTILVDCDMRKARTHRYLEIERGEGVSNVLCGFAGLSKVIRKDVRPNLDVITAGEIPPNPAELLETEEFEKLIGELREKYEYIFIDTPPVTVVTDATVVVKHSMGAVLVARANVTTHDKFERAVDALNRTGVKLLGAILVGREEAQAKVTARSKKKYGYKYDYGYYYGDIEEVKSGKANKK